jgi:hypothetical protein
MDYCVGMLLHFQRSNLPYLEFLARLGAWPVFSGPRPFLGLDLNVEVGFRGVIIMLHPLVPFGPWFSYSLYTISDLA